ncbi:MAG: ABC transporter permease subunit [Acholeplasmatales bacterium]|nr:ABC transporter permease subunit [Acholeplasmatales bacterium]
MNKILTIMKKELRRVFTNPSIIVMMFIMPGLLLFLVYQFIGLGLENRLKDKINYQAKVSVINASSDVQSKLNLLTDPHHPIFTYLDDSAFLEQKELLAQGKIDYLIYCDNYLSQATFYYNSHNSHNDIQIPLVQALVEEAFIATRYYSLSAQVDIIPASEQGISSDMLIMASFIPMLIMTFLFQGAMSVAPESIAGEKERGTISTLLSTPVKRSYIAIGKILALIILCILSATSSFLGLFFSLDKVMVGVEFSYGLYGFGYIALMFVMIVLTVALIVTITANISALSKTIQQASAMCLPLMFLSMFVGLSTMLTNGASANNFLYLIPIYNSSQILFQLFTIDLNVTQLIITLVANLVYILGFIFLLTKLFNSEKVMFNK